MKLVLQALRRYSAKINSLPPSPRIAIFESIQNEQHLFRLSLSADPIRITLPDGSVKPGKRWWTTPYDIARTISNSLASKALVCTVNGDMWDLTRPLEADCVVKLFTYESKEGADTFWRSSAMILGEGFYYDGFYYDGFYGDLRLKKDDLKRIEDAAKRAVSQKQPFERIEVTKHQGYEIFADNRFKEEIIMRLPVDKTITVYRCGPLVDLCRGPHIPNTYFVKAFSCLKATSASWRGLQGCESLQRVYGISYPDQKRLKEHKDMFEEAEKYHHKKLAESQKLFYYHPRSPGGRLLQHGHRVYKMLQKFMRFQYQRWNYQEVTPPGTYKMQMWAAKHIVPVHVEVDDKSLLHCFMFDQRKASCDELPIRCVSFDESEEVKNLTLAGGFQKNAHIFSRESQIKDEVKGVLELISYVYGIFGFTFELELSSMPGTFGKYHVEKSFREALHEFGKPFQIKSALGSPKIQISLYNSMRRKFQGATLKLDVQLPSVFNLTYLAKDESKRELTAMIHGANFGSTECMIAMLLEHYKGKWPFWLSPRHAIVCPVSEKYRPYGLELHGQIKDAFYVDIDTRDTTIQKKIREAQLSQYNFILVVGEFEASRKQVSVRPRDSPSHTKDEFVRMSVGDLLQLFADEFASSIFH